MLKVFQPTEMQQKMINMQNHLLMALTSSKDQPSTRSLGSAPLGDHINPSIIPVNLFILSPRTANSLHPLWPHIISSILYNNAILSNVHIATMSRPNPTFLCLKLWKLWLLCRKRKTRLLSHIPSMLKNND